MKCNFFVYGTLMLQEVRETIGVKCNNYESAIIQNYDCRYVIGEEYPALFSSQGIYTKGQILYSISEEEKILLDSYEGDQYRREKIQAILENGNEIECFVYIFLPELKNRIGDKKWDVTNVDSQHVLAKYCR